MHIRNLYLHLLVPCAAGGEDVGLPAGSALFEPPRSVLERRRCDASSTLTSWCHGTPSKSFCDIAVAHPAASFSTGHSGT